MSSGVCASSRELPAAKLLPARGAWVLALALVLAVIVLSPVPLAEAAPAPGSSADFWVEDWAEEATVRISASVAAVGEHGVVYVQDGRTVPDRLVDGLVEDFDAAVYPSLSSLFGPAPEPGIDEEPLITILLYGFGDRAIKGYFDPSDMDHSAAGFDRGNQREMFYLNLDPLLLEPELAGSVLAHEFAHLLIYYRDVMLSDSPSAAREDRWLEEGMAMYAEEEAGFPGRTQAQLESFAAQPDKNLTRWEGGYQSDYGAAYAFTSYLVQRTDADVLAELLDDPEAGIASIDAVLDARDSAATFYTLFDDWIIANFLDTRSPSDSSYFHSSFDIRAESAEVPSPLPQVGDGTVRAYAARYFDVSSVSGSLEDAIISAVLDGQDDAPLRAALIGWDSEGAQTPSVTRLDLTGSYVGGEASSLSGYDRHTLAVWAEGPPGSDTTYHFRYRLAENGEDMPQFLDVGSDHLFYRYISPLAEAGVVSGFEVPQGSGLYYFKSEDDVLRAQLAKMVMEAIGMHTAEIEAIGEPSFTDVSPVFDEERNPAAYPYDYVEEAAAAGIVLGYEDGSFGPWRPTTRMHLVRMVLRAAEAAGEPYQHYTGREDVFADVDPGSPLYQEVMTAYTEGVLSGSIGSDGRRYFRPWGRASRGHVSKMMANLWKDLQGGN